MFPSFTKRRNRKPNSLTLFAVEEAKKVCIDCKDREYCLDLAIRYGEGYGIWAGIHFAETSDIKANLSPSDFARWDKNNKEITRARQSWGKRLTA